MNIFRDARIMYSLFVIARLSVPKIIKKNMWEFFFFFHQMDPCLTIDFSRINNENIKKPLQQVILKA